MTEIPLNVCLLLAQGSAPPLPGEGLPLPDPAAAGSAGAGAGAGGAPTGGGGSLFILFVIVVVGMLVFTIYAQRRDSKRREKLIGSVKKHDKVQTIGGVIGSVVEVKDHTIVLKVDESSNTRITFARSAIAQVLSESAEPAA
jgi:preprotein translocase subunit YajC